jgi:hypothetical protein
LNCVIAALDVVISQARRLLAMPERICALHCPPTWHGRRA